MKRGSLRWFVKASSDRLWALLEKPVRNTGAFVFRKAADIARSARLLARPAGGEGILVVNLTSHFGDGIMLLPMLEAIHQSNPGVPLDIACSRGVESLFQAIPFVRHVYAAPLSSEPPLKFSEAVQRRLQILRWYRSDLQHLHPRVCLMPRWGDDLFASLYLGYLVGAPVRVGYSSTVDTYQRDAPQRDKLLTKTVDGGSGMHEPMRFLRVAQQGRLISEERTFRTDIVSETLRTIAENVAWEPLRARLGLPREARFAVLAPGASRPNKTWPAEHWIAAGQALLREGFDVLLLSGKADRDYAEGIASALHDDRVHVAAGVTSLPESICLLSHAACFLGNDSGPGHAAGALGVPTVVLFASGPDVYPDHSLSPVRVGPMGPYVRTLQPERLLEGCSFACTTAFPHCITTIPPERAVEAVLDLVRQRNA